PSPRIGGGGKERLGMGWGASRRAEARRKRHPVPDSEKMEVQPHHRLGGERDAVEDYLEPAAKAAWLRLHRGPFGEKARRDRPGSRASSSLQQPSPLFRLRAAWPRL